MYCKEKFNAMGCLFLLAAILNLFLVSDGFCQAWERIALDGGGVAHDVQFTRHYLGNKDVIWSTCMNTGVYRATYSGSSWSSWTEYLPGIGTLGLDAIKVGSVEHVLVGSGGFGIFYATSSTNYDFFPSLNPPSRPNDDVYPDDWGKNARIHDVAFYWPAGETLPLTPDGEIFAMLHTGLLYPERNPGIYRWDVSLTPDNFKRVDSQNDDDPARYFAYFKRDIGSSNVLYAVLSARDANPQYDGALYRFSGTYTQASPSFIAIPETDIVGSGNDLLDVLGFNQYVYNSQVYSYLLAKWVDNSGTPVTKFSVFVGVDVADDETPTFTLIDIDYSDYFPDADPATCSLPVSAPFLGCHGDFRDRRQHQGIALTPEKCR